MPQPTASALALLPQVARRSSFAAAARAALASPSLSSMLSRRNRLDRGAVGELSTGKRAHVAHFSVVARPSNEARAAAVVSKKVAKKAVDRHLVKRRMIEALKPHLRGNRSFVVYARAGAPTLSFRALKEEIDTLLRTV